MLHNAAALAAFCKHIGAVRKQASGFPAAHTFTAPMHRFVP
jgi:hypothetical protein